MDSDPSSTVDLLRLAGDAPPLAGAILHLPAVIDQASGARRRFVEFFTAEIRNPPYAEDLRQGGGPLPRLV